MKNFIGIDYRIGNIVEVSMFDSEDAYESEKDDYLDTKDCPNKEWHLAEITSIDPNNSDYTFGLNVEAQCNAYVEIWERLKPAILGHRELINLGFKTEDKIIYIENELRLVGFRVEFIEELKGYCLVLHNEVLNRSFIIKELKYIHELQNFYYLLLGIEIETAGGKL